MAYTPAAPLNKYALKRQDPLTQGARLAEQQNTQGIQTGNFADVQSAANANQRANAARSASALQAARGTVARAGGEFSPEAAIRAEDQAQAQANAQNLSGTNQVNQMQRQYRQDALNRADTYEQNAQTGAIGERNYQSNLDAADLAQKNQEVGFGFQDRQLGQTDTAQANDMTKYNLTRGDANSQFDKTLGQRDKEFGVTSSQTDRQLGQTDTAQTNEMTRYNLSRGDQNKQFDVTSGQNQQQINNQVDQFGKTLGQRDKEFGVTSSQTDRQLGQTDTAQANDMTKYNLTRGDTNSQFDKTLGQRQTEFGVTSGQSQQQINNQASQFEKNYGLDATRVDQSQQQIDNQASQFGVTSGQNQQQIENQAAQAAAQMGYNYASLSQNDRQYLMDMVQRRSEFNTTTDQFNMTRDDKNRQFDVTSSQTDRQLGQTDTAQKNEMDRYNLTRGDQNAQNATANAQQDRLIGIQETKLTADTSNEQYNKTMDAINSIPDPKAKSAAMAAYLRGEDVAGFITNNIYGQDGSLNTDYTSASPGAQKVQNLKDELTATYPTKSPQEIDAMVQKRLEDADAATNAPLTAARDQVTADALTKKLNSGQPLSQAEEAQAIESKAVKTYADKGLNEYAGKTGAAKLAQNPGGLLAIGGKVYKVGAAEQVVTGSESNGWGGYSDRHTDYTELVASDGTKKYIWSSDGQLHNEMPKKWESWLG